MLVSPEFSEINFYVAAVQLLQREGIPFRVGGAYALREYTGVFRDTKDFDIFARPGDIPRILEVFRAEGYRAELAFSHWIAKVHHAEAFIDVIYRAGNGLCEVDDEWFRPTITADLMGEKVELVPPEEIIWQKAYIMERERFDGADIAHLLRARAQHIQWDHLLARFGPDWRVLLPHLILFGYIYPGERHLIPEHVMQDLLGRVRSELTAPSQDNRLCQGTVLSRAQFLPDVERWGYTDARTTGRCQITEEEIERWTDAIGKERAWGGA